MHTDQEHANAMMGIIGDGDVPANLFDDWSEEDYRGLLKMVVWHRLASPFVDSIVKRKLKESVSASFWASLLKITSNSRYLSLSQLSVLPRINQAFDDSGVEFLYLKGIVLSSFLYQTPHARHSKDVDIWVDENQVTKACELILGAGFTLLKPAKLPSGMELVRYMRVQKDMIFVSQDNLPIELELHWRLDKNKHAFPLQFNQAYRHKMVVDVDGHACPTLSLESTVLYLCAHGSAAMFGRMKWLLDAAQGFKLIQQVPSSNQQLKRLSAQLGQDASVRFTKSLVNQVISTKQAGGVAPIKNSFWNKVLLRAVFQNIRNSDYLPLYKRWFLRLLLVSGLRYKLEQINLALRLAKGRFLAGA